MNRAALMLSVLSDGQRHSRGDLFNRCGFFLTNNAASELRAQGHDIEQTRERVNGGVVYFYRLRRELLFDFTVPDHFGSLPERDATALNPLSLSESEHLVGSFPDETDQSSVFLSAGNDDGKHDGKHDPTDGGRLVSSESEQPELFPSTSHRAPEAA